MATNSNIVVRNYDPLQVIKVSVASATVLASGDLVTLNGTTGGAAIALSGATNATFIGVCLVGSESGEIAPISVARRATISVEVAATAATIGIAYAYAAGANGTKWTVTPTTTGAIMWANEEIAVGSSGEFYIDSSSLLAGLLYQTAVSA